jgi:5-(carboxyamino)imidazole ribonucleotide mutase
LHFRGLFGGNHIIAALRYFKSRLFFLGVSRYNRPLFWDNPEQAMPNPSVAVVMGSSSDWPVMQHATEYLERFGIEYQARVVSAHRTPDLLAEFGKQARDQGIACIIAGAGGAAHLPGMLAANTTVPVLGVPIPSEHLRGLDSLYSIVQMPKGVPVATFAIGNAGAINAALFAVALLAGSDPVLAQKLEDFRRQQRDTVLDMTLPPAD